MSWSARLRPGVPGVRLAAAWRGVPGDRFVALGGGRAVCRGVSFSGSA